MSNEITYTVGMNNQFSVKANQVQKSTDKMGNAFTRLQTKTRAASAGMISLGKKSTALGNKMRSTSLVAAGALAGSVAAFADLESGIETVFTLLEDDQVEKFGGEIDALTKNAMKFGFTIGDSSKAMFDNVSAMGATTEGMDTFSESQRLAIAGNTQLGIAVDGMTSIMKAYDGEIKSATRVSNAFFSAQKFGKTTVAELAQNVGQIAPFAKRAGVEMEDMLATLSQLTLKGLSTDLAATALKNVLVTLLNAKGQQAALLRSQQIPVGPTALRKTNLPDVLAQIAQVAERSPDIIGLLFPNIRAGTGVGAIDTKDVERIRFITGKIAEDIANNTGLTKAYNRQLETSKLELGGMWGNIKLMAAAIGSSLKPVISLISTLIGGFAEKFLSLNESSFAWVATLLGVVAVVGPILAFFGKFMIVVGTITGFIISWPGLIVAAIATMSVFVYRNLDFVKAKIGNVFTGLGFSNPFAGKETNEPKTTPGVASGSQHELTINTKDNAGIVEDQKLTTTNGSSAFSIGEVLMGTR